MWITADRDNRLTVVGVTGLTVRDLVTKQKTLLPDKRTDAVATDGGLRHRYRRVVLQAALGEVAHAPGRRRARRRGPANHARAPFRQGRLPGRARLAGPEARRAQAGDGQPAAAGQLPARASSPARPSRPGRRPRWSRRRSRLARTRRSSVRNPPRRSTRSATPPRARSTAASPPSTPRRTPPSRRRRGRYVSTQPGSPRSPSSPPATAGSRSPARSPTWSRGRTRTTGGPATPAAAGPCPSPPATSRGTTRPSARSPRSPSTPATATAVGRPRAGHDAHRHGRLGADHGRGLPVPRRPQVLLVHAAGHRLTSDIPDADRPQDLLA